jgi:hypothetical protein
MRKALSVAALLAGSIIPAFGMAAEPLGRLFFTPAQRSVLDAGKTVATQAPVVPAPRTVHLTGVVTRSDAENTVWINGTAYHDASPAGVQIKTDRSAPESTAIRVPGKTATTRVKVGQQVDLNSGRIQEDFTRRPATTAGPAAPVENPVARPVAERKSKATENAAAAAGDKGTNAATVAR